MGLLFGKLCLRRIFVGKAGSRIPARSGPGSRCCLESGPELRPAGSCLPAERPSSPST